MEKSKATIKCNKCGIEGTMELNEWSEEPIISFYLPKGWRLFRLNVYCKNCTKGILQKIENIL